MNSDQVKSLVRSVLMILCGGGVGVFLVKHGITLDDNFYTMATTIIAGAIGIGWSQIHHAANPTT